MEWIRKSMVVMAMFCLVQGVYAQNAAQARKILDKTAALIKGKGGATANFSMSGKYGTSSGTIAIKGNKFTASTTQANVWYDGKTMWTYVKNTQEVNISNPTEAQQQSMNPYKFLTIYKNGFNLGMTTLSSGWKIHLTAANQQRSIKEMYITVDKNYYPKEIKMRQNNGWCRASRPGVSVIPLSASMPRIIPKPKSSTCDEWGRPPEVLYI